jgi:cell division protein FtsB
MSEMPPKKFKYKKDEKDWVLIGIIIFTLVCFALIVLSIRYFDTLQTSTGDTIQRNELDELVENRDKLEEQINQYVQDPDFNPNN